MKKISFLIIAALIFFTVSTSWAVNSITSRTSPIAAGVVTQTITAKEGVFILVKYTKGDSTSLTIAPTFIFKNISTSDQYQPLIIDDTTPTVQTYQFTVTGNYQIPLGVANGASTLKVTLTLDGGTTAVVVCDIQPQ